MTPSRLTKLFLAVIVAGSSVVWLPVSPAAALDGLAIRSSTTYKVQPEQESIFVEATYSVTNVTPNRTTSRGTTQYFYSGLSIPVPIDAVDLSAVRSDGRTLQIDLDEDDADAFTIYGEVSFGRNVFYRSTTTFTVSYTLPSGEARSDDSGVRVNPAYAVFGAYGIGDPNAVSVRVEVPLEFDVEVEGSEFSSSEEDGLRIYESTDIADPQDFYLVVVARNDDALIERVVELPDGKEVNIQHWPGDIEWANFVEERLEEDFVEMQNLIGVPFRDEELQIIESVDPSLQGYAGWYIPDEELIEVSEELDAHLILHELSHAWFNGETFRGRWITEGFAEEFSARAIEASGERLPNPTTPLSFDVNRVELNAWTVRFSNDRDAQLQEEYGYNASWFVMRSLTRELGIEGLAQIVQEADEDLIPYRGEAEPEKAGETPEDWRRFLDLAEERAGSEKIEEVFRKFVLRDHEMAILDRRAELRTNYAELAAGGGDWAVPYGIRDRMTRWSFVNIDEIFETASESIDQRDDLLMLTDRLELNLPDTAEVAYQAAEEVDELHEVHKMLANYGSTATLIESAQAATQVERGIVERVGLLRSDHLSPYEDARQKFEADDLDAATESAQQAIDGFEASASVGQQRLLTAGGGFLALLMAMFLLLRWRRKRRVKAREGDSSRPGSDDETSGSVIDGPEAPAVPQFESTSSL